MQYILKPHNNFKIIKVNNCKRERVCRNQQHVHYTLRIFLSALTGNLKKKKWVCQRRMKNVNAPKKRAAFFWSHDLGSKGVEQLYEF